MEEHPSIWTCICGTNDSGNFCSECRKPKEHEDTWTCQCGTENKGKFCTKYGNPRPKDGIVCSNPECGFTSDDDMKFCPNCDSPNKQSSRYLDMKNKQKLQPLLIEVSACLFSFLNHPLLFSLVEVWQLHP